ncbi:MAG: L,D-transpeptidase, partial [Bacteroidales bacterium]|nr:L,D-transpeptidase [Bacteroidales bacterium]
FKAIGIHGSCPHRDDRIGTRDSKGCIRLHNADLLELLPYVEKGTKVIILPGPEDACVDEDL